ncbi:MAG: four helix bundle protein [Bacteroidota bacterium]
MINAEELKKRTKNLALRVIKLFKALPNTAEAQLIGKQLLRSSTSLAANYRAACVSRSRKEFLAKLSIVVEEADESLFWLEILGEAAILPQEKLRLIANELQELLFIFSASRKTAKNNLSQAPNKKITQ